MFNEEKIWLRIIFGGLLAVLLALSDEQHDWGDDFAMYLQQSINISAGRAQSDNHYLFNPDAPEYAPKTYSLGFPLMLSPIWIFKTNKILLAKYILVACFVFILFFVYLIVRKRTDSISFAALITTLIGLAFYLMDLEKQILADLPLFLWVGLWWFLFAFGKPKTNVALVITGMVCAMAYLTKTIGAACIVTTIIFLLVKSTKEDIYRNIKNSVLVVLVFVSTVFAMNVLCKQEASNDSHFLSLIFSGNIEHTILQNILIYKNETYAIIGTLGHHAISIIARIMSYLWCILFMAGFIIDIRKEMRVEHIFCLLYLAGILVFPNFEQGNRYLIPLVPFFFYFAFVPFVDKLKYSKHLVGSVMVLIIALQLLSLDKKAPLKNRRAFQSGALKMYEQIKRNTKNEDHILTTKPRLIGYMTERDCGTVSKEATEAAIIGFIKREDIRYILVQNCFNHPGLMNYVAKHAQEVRPYIIAEEYQLYEVLSLQQSQ